MKQKQSWFQLYPESNRASNLSIAGGAVRLLSLLLLIAAIGATLVLLLAGARLTAAAGVGTALIFLLGSGLLGLFHSLFYHIFLAFFLIYFFAVFIFFQGSIHLSYSLLWKIASNSPCRCFSDFNTCS